MAQVFLGRSQEAALLRAVRVAGWVVLILLLGVGVSRLLVLVGVLPGWLPFSWWGVGGELLAKGGGAFVVVLFWHLLRWLIRGGRRRVALMLVGGDGTGVFLLCLDELWGESSFQQGSGGE